MAVFSIAWKEAPWVRFYTGAPRRQRLSVERYNSHESLRTLSERYGINQKTVAKWKKGGSVVDLPTGPKAPRSTVLSIEEEATIVALRRMLVRLRDETLGSAFPKAASTASASSSPSGTR